MTFTPATREDMIRAVVAKARPLEHADPAYHWLLGLHEMYPDDIGILAPLFLNLIEIAPGEALYLPAGELHAYLHGVGIELMANSDNVLRGGLTPKHIDLRELIQVLNFEAHAIEVLIPAAHPEGELRYSTPTEEFVLSAVQVLGDSHYRSSNNRSIEMLLCVDGQAWIEASGTHERMEVHKGTSVVVSGRGPVIRD